jgi:cellobiose PTS system EIIA component
MDLEQIAFEIISQAGDSFSHTMVALELSREHKFKEAEQEFLLADTSLTEAHKTHSQLLFDFANGKITTPNILLVHAQDHLTKAEVMLELGKRIVILEQKLN